MDVEEKYITLNVYKSDDEGALLDFDTTTNAQPKENCLSVKISKREEMQVKKLRVKIKGIRPYVEASEPLLYVREGEFGYELVKEKENEPSE